VYLLSGLTKPQRRSALRRLRLSARMGHCPAAPSSSAPQPAPSATHAASSGVCLKVGPLRLCLNV